MLKCLLALSKINVYSIEYSYIAILIQVVIECSVINLEVLSFRTFALGTRKMWSVIAEFKATDVTFTLYTTNNYFISYHIYIIYIAYE